MCYQPDEPHSPAPQYFFRYRSFPYKLKREADAGNVHAQSELAKRYRTGDKVGQSDDLADYYTKLAADQGDSYSLFYLGQLLETLKDEQPIPYEKIAQCYLKADYSAAQVRLGYFYSRGLGVPQSDEKAFENYLKAANFNEYRAIFYLAQCYELGKGTPQSLEKAKELYAKGLEYAKTEAKISENECEGMAMLQKALCLKSSEQYPSSTKECKNFVDCLFERSFWLLSQVFLYSKAKAEIGDLESILKVAEFYQKGYGVDKSAEMAQHYFHKLEENPNQAEVQYFIGSSYDYAKNGYPCNPEKAAKYYLKAADNGHAIAQYCIGTFFEKGIAVQQSKEKALEYYKKSAEQGYVFALGALALWKDMPLNNSYFQLCAQAPFNEQESLDRIHIAKSMKNESTMRLKRCYEEIRNCYFAKAKCGDVESQCKLADIYRQGLGFEMNDKEKQYQYTKKLAKEFYSRAATRGNSKAKRWLGYILERDEQNFNLAFKNYDEAVLAGDACAAGLLAQCYEEGKGTEKNIEKANIFYEVCAHRDWNLNELQETSFDWGHVQAYVYNKAHAAFDNKAAISKLVDCYANGDGTIISQERSDYYRQLLNEVDETSNDSEKENFYPLRLRVASKELHEGTICHLKKMADKGDVEAQYKLCWMYRFGEKVEKSYDLFLHYLQLAANQGDSYAQFHLGQVFEEGTENVANSYDKAIYYYQLAAEQGEIRSNIALGHLYSQGLGVEQSFEKAFHHYEQVAKKKDGKGFLLLAYCYEMGRGIPQDIEKAKYYYSLGLKHCEEDDIKLDEESGESLADLANSIKESKKASLLELAYAERNLDISFREYQGVFLYHKAKAELGDKQSILKVAKFYQEGKGVEKSSEMEQSYLEILTDIEKQERLAKLIPSDPEDARDLTILTLRDKADNGNVDAQHRLAWCFKDGTGVQPSLDLFQHYLIQSADGGNRDAQLELGWFYDCGDAGFVSDPKKAAQYYLKAAQNGDSSAQFYVGYCFEYGIGVKQSFESAFLYYEMAAKQQNGVALARLGLLYQEGQGTLANFDKAIESYEQSCLCPFDEEKAFARIRYAQNLNTHAGFLNRCIEEAATQYEVRGSFGDLTAECKAANLYRSINSKGSLEKSIDLYRSPAHEKDPEAMCWLGFFYERGIIIDSEHPYQDAIFYYTKAAEQGNALAQGCLGYCYERGYGVERSLEKASDYYRLCVSGKWDLPDDLNDITCNIGHVKKFIYNRAKAYFGDVEAQYNLGMCFKDGDGVQQSFSDALLFLRAAATHGHCDAQFQVGEILDFEDFDFADAAKFYQLAANQDHARALAYLAYLYQFGLGVPQSYDRALNLYKIAAGKFDIFSVAILQKHYEQKARFSKKYEELANKYFHLHYRLLKNAPAEELNYLTRLCKAEKQEKENPGNALLQLRTGLICHRCILLNDKNEEAITYFHLAENNGNSIAKKILSTMTEPTCELDTGVLNGYITEIFNENILNRPIIDFPAQNISRTITHYTQDRPISDPENLFFVIEIIKDPSQNSVVIILGRVKMTNSREAFDKVSSERRLVFYEDKKFTVHTKYIEDFQTCTFEVKENDAQYMVSGAYSVQVIQDFEYQDRLQSVSYIGKLLKSKASKKLQKTMEILFYKHVWKNVGN